MYANRGIDRNICLSGVVGFDDLVGDLVDFFKRHTTSARDTIKPFLKLPHGIGGEKGGWYYNPSGVYGR